MKRLNVIASNFLRTLVLCAAMAVYTFPSSALMVQENPQSMSETMMETVMDHCAEEADGMGQECCETSACECPWMGFTGVFAAASNSPSTIDHGPSKPGFGNNGPTGIHTRVPNPPPIS